MTRYIGLYELVAAYRAAAKPTPAPGIEPARVEVTAEQFVAMDESAGITS